MGEEKGKDVHLHAVQKLEQALKQRIITHLEMNRKWD